MRLAICCLRFPPARGGVESVAASQARFLAARHQVEVHTTDLAQHKRPARLAGIPPIEERDGYRIVRHPAWCPPTSRFSYPLIPALLRPGFAAGCDLLYAHSFWYFPAWAAARAARARGVPFVLQPHYDPKAGAWNRAYRQLAGRRLIATADLTVLVSPFEERMLAADGLRPARTLLVPNAVDPAGFGDDPALRPEIDRESPYAVFVGRLDRGKGVDVLLRALARPAGSARPLRAVIIGDDFGARAELEALAGSLGIADRVRFLAGLPRPAVDAWVRGAAALVLPSRYEAFGVVVLEAWALGTPAVVAGATALADLVRDGVTGLQFRPDDDAHLAARLAAVVEPGLRERLTAAGRAELQAGYTPAASYGRLEAALVALAARARV